MTVTFHKLSIVGAVLILLAGCSLPGKLQVAGQMNTQHASDETDAVHSAALEACLPEAGSPFHFRKAVFVAGTIAVPNLARDLPGLAPLTSKRLQTHLDELQRFNVSAKHTSSFKSNAAGTAARVMQLGREFESQFVVKIELEDLTMHSSAKWLPEFIRGNNRRNVLINLYIYDTEYGALFHAQRYQGLVKGNVVGYPGNAANVTTPWFNTDLGKQVDTMLKDMSVQINEKLACVPFSTEIIAVKGKDIHINAGYLHGVRPGETLRVYRSSDIMEPEGTQKQRDTEGWIKVNAVFPSHSIASASQNDIDSNRMNRGDVVRAW